MKKEFVCMFLLAAIAILMPVSCGKEQKESDGEKKENKPTPGTDSGKDYTFSASAEMMGWHPGDEITLFDGNSSVKSSTSDSGASATFTAKLSSEGPWYALYPAEESASATGSVVTTVLPSFQNAVESAYEGKVNLSLALSKNNSLAFKSAVGFVKFAIPEDNIKSVVLTGNKGESLAGKVKIDYNSGSPVWEDAGGVASISLSGSFLKGSTYFIAVLPQTFTDGVTLVFTDDSDNETIVTHSEELVLSRAQVTEVSTRSAISFADEDVKNALLAVPGLDADSDGEITKDEAAAVTSEQLDKIVGAEGADATALWGDDLSAIETFEELKFFSGLSYLPAIFSDCASLTKVSLPAAITAINKGCFRNCTSLAELELPSNLQKIYAEAFKGCTLLSYLRVPSGVDQISTSAFEGCTALETADNLGETVLEIIGAAAFKDCTSLTAISIPASVKTVGKNAFYGCTSLATVTGGSGVTDLGAGAFMNCTSLTSISITGVNIIGQDVFNGCSKLASVKVSPNLRQIGIQAFLNCTSLTTFSDTGTDDGFRMPATVTALLRQAFDGCSSLPNPDFSRCAGLDTLENRCFRFCQSFTEIDLPASVTFIVRAFSCSKSKPLKITKMTIRAAVPPRTGKYSIFEYDEDLPTICVPASSIEDYKTAGTSSNTSGRTDANNYRWYLYAGSYEPIPEE